MSNATVDVAGFYAAIDAKRRVEKLSWRALAHDLGVTPSTFTRMTQGGRPDVDTFAALLRWLEMPVEAFMEPQQNSGAAEQEPITMIGTYLRMDRNLTREAAEALEQLIRIAYERLRTTPAPQ
jgi:transcriptional regulator with XRE-family HTH domain